MGKALEAARWVPSWANAQCWRFIVVTDKDVKAQLNATSPVRPPPPTSATTPPPPPAHPVLDAPVAIAICADLNKAGVRPDGTPATDKGDTWYMYDTALAT